MMRFWTTKTMTRGVIRPVVAALAAAGGLAVGASPALANSVIQPWNMEAHMQTGDGALADFSYTQLNGQMARNIKSSVYGFAPNTGVTFSWSDDNATWHAGPTVASNGVWWSAQITNIPRSECNKTLSIKASGQTGVETPSGPNFSTLYPASATYVLTENCGPSVWLTNSGIEGDGFTPGGSATVETYTTLNVQLTTQYTTATPSSATHCYQQAPLGTICLSVAVRGGGQIDVANALNLTTQCHPAETYVGIDGSTGLFDNVTGVCFM